MAGGVSERALLPPPRHAPVHELRIAGETLVRPESEALHHAGAESLDEGVGLLNEAEHGLYAVGMLEVDSDRPPPPVEHVLVGVQHPGVRAVDTEHLGAHVGQHHRRKRPWADAGHLDHLEALQRSSHVMEATSRPNGAKRVRAEGYPPN